jgi:hypothetical protein
VAFLIYFGRAAGVQDAGGPVSVASERVVGGGNTDNRGRFQVQVTIGDDPPGVYRLRAVVRGSRQELTLNGVLERYGVFLCRVP